MLDDLNSGGSLHGAYFRGVGKTAISIYPPTGLAVSIYGFGDAVRRGDMRSAGSCFIGIASTSYSVKNHYKEFGFRQPFSRTVKSTPQCRKVTEMIKENGGAELTCDQRATYSRFYDRPSYPIHITRPSGIWSGTRPYFKGKYNFHIGVTRSIVNSSNIRNTLTVEPLLGKTYVSHFSWATGQGYGGYNASFLSSGVLIPAGILPQPYLHIYYAVERNTK